MVPGLGRSEAQAEAWSILRLLAGTSEVCPSYLPCCHIFSAGLKNPSSFLSSTRCTQKISKGTTMSPAVSPHTHAHPGASIRRSIASETKPLIVDREAPTPPPVLYADRLLFHITNICYVSHSSTPVQCAGPWFHPIPAYRFLSPHRTANVVTLQRPVQWALIITAPSRVAVSAELGT